MPLDLNTFTQGKLTEEVAKLRPGQSLMSSDGLIIRRRPTTSGYDCGIGLGGYGSLRCRTAREAADDLLARSARHVHPKALGGEKKFTDIESAFFEIGQVREDRQVEPEEEVPQTPALIALRSVASKAGLHSYRIRARRAREALTKDDPATAVRHLEAIIEHAQVNGSAQDVHRAKEALAAVRLHHEYDVPPPKLEKAKIEVRVVDGQHFVYRGGREVSVGLTEAEASSRAFYMAQQAERESGAQAIDNEIAGVPNLVREGGTPTEDDAA